MDSFLISSNVGSLKVPSYWSSNLSDRDMNSFLDSNKSRNLDKSKYFQIMVSGSSGSLMLELLMYIRRKMNYFLEKTTKGKVP